jgi:hypothetical protein
MAAQETTKPSRATQLSFRPRQRGTRVSYSCPVLFAASAGEIKVVTNRNGERHAAAPYFHLPPVHHDTTLSAYEDIGKCQRKKTHL